MWKILPLCLLVANLLLATAPEADAHAWYSLALKKKYDFQVVSCYTCHLSGKEAAATMTHEELAIYKAKSRRYLNGFGKQFSPLLSESEVAKEIDFLYLLRRRSGGVPASPAGMQAMRDLREKGQQELLEVLSKVEAIRERTTGKTYGDLLRNGELEGIKLRTEPRRMPSDF